MKKQPDMTEIYGSEHNQGRIYKDFISHVNNQTNCSLVFGNCPSLIWCQKFK